MTLRCVPAFTLRRVDDPLPLEEALDALDELADANDHFEFYVFPHTDVALTRTTPPTSRPSRRGRARRLLETLLENHVFGLLCRAGRRFPRGSRRSTVGSRGWPEPVRWTAATGSSPASG